MKFQATALRLGSLLDPNHKPVPGYCGQAVCDNMYHMQNKLSFRILDVPFRNVAYFAEATKGPFQGSS